MKITTATFLVAAALASGACKKKANTRVDATTATPTQRDRGGAAARPATASSGVTTDAGDGASFSPVYFEFDSTQLSAQARDELARLARWMQRHPEATAQIEGHCDERGTTEYNVALGERRAQTIRDYLVRLGVPEHRLSTISYGEERPAATDDGEEAWALNRRGELATRR